jgi:hypothetical protein
MIQVFVSHSSKDAPFVKLVVKFLETFGLGRDEVRCTSLPGYGLRLGAYVSLRLRDEIAQCKAMIGVITADSLASRNVLLELGAGWGLKKTLIPVLGPGLDYSDMIPWLAETHWMNWNDRPCWEQFKEIFYEDLHVNVKSRPRFKAAIRKLITYDFKAQPKVPHGRRLRSTF